MTVIYVIKLLLSAIFVIVTIEYMGVNETH